MGIPSIIGAALNGKNGHNHDYEWYEVWDNQLSYSYFKNRSYQFIDTWNEDNIKYPRKKTRYDYYDELSFNYYFNPVGLITYINEDIKNLIINSTTSPTCGLL